ncbi:unnamed protein product, partial [Urochloa humidicola]
MGERQFPALPTAAAAAWFSLICNGRQPGSVPDVVGGQVVLFSSSLFDQGEMSEETTAG